MVRQAPPIDTAQDNPTPTSSTTSVDSNNKNHNLFKCAHLNTQSLRHKMDEFTAEVETFDAIAVTETWFQTHKTPQQSQDTTHLLEKTGKTDLEEEWLSI